VQLYYCLQVATGLLPCKHLFVCAPEGSLGGDLASPAVRGASIGSCVYRAAPCPALPCPIRLAPPCPPLSRASCLSTPPLAQSSCLPRASPTPACRQRRRRYGSATTWTWAGAAAYTSQVGLKGVGWPAGCNLAQVAACCGGPSPLQGLLGYLCLPYAALPCPVMPCPALPCPACYMHSCLRSSAGLSGCMQMPPASLYCEAHAESTKPWHPLC